jgi:dipeptidyl aminopeptidase/acylaminoacyl peptidase
VLAALLSALVLALPAAAPSDRPLAVPAGGGVTLAGTLTVPAGPGPHPAAVIVGGFGPSGRDGGLGGEEGAYATLARRLAERGVAVLRYDKRGIGMSGGAPLSWLDSRPLARDAAAAVRTLAVLPGVDRRRIALIGHSQGGDLALDAASRSPATRVVTLAAPGRPLRLLPRVSGAAARLLDRLVGPRAARATLGSDPRRAAVRAARPALLVHGTRDGTVPVSDLDRLAAVRRAAGLPTATLRVPGADHFLQVGGRMPEATVERVASFVTA